MRITLTNIDSDRRRQEARQLSDALKSGMSISDAVASVWTPEQRLKMRRLAEMKRRGRILSSFVTDVMTNDDQTGVSARRGVSALELTAMQLTASAAALTVVVDRMGALMDKRLAQQAPRTQAPSESTPAQPQREPASANGHVAPGWLDVPSLD